MLKTFSDFARNYLHFAIYRFLSTAFYLLYVNLVLALIFVLKT